MLRNDKWPSKKTPTLFPFFISRFFYMKHSSSFLSPSIVSYDINEKLSLSEQLSLLCFYYLWLMSKAQGVFSPSSNFLLICAFFAHNVSISFTLFFPNSTKVFPKLSQYCYHIHMILSCFKWLLLLFVYYISHWYHVVLEIQLGSCGTSSCSRYFIFYLYLTS